ncbi:hypothetical protein TPHA_0C03720 [Tetrapisispora phaffii CBS 4417]|uniref:Autophagy-related protein 16 domain-containing protein n=1 Tax=Tetrapisispora phaffii (strain ATCC 24235 / CBS 4417 / NBRC 1672 / NRRL Y-8282 / UCD 70-5) TaxID=1071381 RepID=G8BQL2_TETPH|nr:hypothetical protein TPHA_0C03720 [Tetrapisispora phaffii CBS 4417]CCE62524.1 hypothetical protein TPHA_0C03720 [Tetrapisispora phaffii CBS 4417]
MADTDEIDKLLVNRLSNRDIVESRYKELFHDLNKPTEDDNQTQDLVDELKQELFKRDSELKKLDDINKVLRHANENSNNEIISLNIENNIMNEKYNKLEVEYNKLIKRWLSKVEKDVQDMNGML